MTFVNLTILIIFRREKILNLKLIFAWKDPNIKSNGIVDIKSTQNLLFTYVIAISLGLYISSSVMLFFIVVLKLRRISRA